MVLSVSPSLRQVISIYLVLKITNFLPWNIFKTVCKQNCCKIHQHRTSNCRPAHADHIVCPLAHHNTLHNTELQSSTTLKDKVKQYFRTRAKITFGHNERRNTKNYSMTNHCLRAMRTLRITSGWFSNRTETSDDEWRARDSLESVLVWPFLGVSSTHAVVKWRPRSLA